MNYLNNVTTVVSGYNSVIIVNTSFVITNTNRHDAKHKSFMTGQRWMCLL